MNKFILVFFIGCGMVFSGLPGIAQAKTKKPNILVVWGDDIGTWNISHNNRGMMGYRTPNIDRSIGNRAPIRRSPSGF